MVPSHRTCPRLVSASIPVVTVVLVLASVSGCGGGASGQGAANTPGEAAALHMVSQPVRYAQVNEQMRYQAVVSKPGAAAWAMEAGPAGATMDEGGNLQWNAAEDQAGDQTFTISATVDGQTARQTFKVTTAASVMQAHGDIDPQDPNGGSVAVDAPLSPMRGAAIQVDPGALPPGAPVAMTISSMEHAPVPPMAAAADVTPSDLIPVELGPSGLAFRKAAKIQLPISPAVLSKGNPIVQTYDYQSGTWQKVRLLSVDRDNGIAVAEVSHFSTYVVTPEVKVIDLKANLGGDGTACGDALVVRSSLAVGFDQIPSAAINGYSGTRATVADALGDLSAGQALQVLIRVSARSLALGGQQTGWALGSATKQANGSFKVNLTTDRHAGGFKTLPATLGGTNATLEAWLNGSHVDFVFGALGSAASGVTASAEVSLYLVPGADADRPPPTSANAIGTEQISEGAPVALTGYDDDCDGAPNAWDSEPNGAAPPAIVGLPGGSFHVTVGTPAALKVFSPQTGVAFTWSASDPSVMMTSVQDGAAATATPSIPGVFQVWVTGTSGGASTRFTWDLTADPPSVLAANTPPMVAITASSNVARVGETVLLGALGKDAEQTALTYAWSSSDPGAASGGVPSGGVPGTLIASGVPASGVPGTLIANSGPTASFLASAPGDYDITCVANDGATDSPPAHVTISVVSAMANRAPGVPSVSPMSAVLQHGPGESVSMMMKARAIDPDGDALTYDFVPDAQQTPTTFTLTKNGSNALFAAARDGVYVFYVTATDSHGAVSPWAPVKVQVFSTLPPTPVDADHDGYPAGFDCDDQDPLVFPGAKEVCGDGVDQNCDGRDLPATGCDFDGDRFSTAQGDCDDHNPAVSPAAVERCDGIDNNCDLVVDEGFDVGAVCATGSGACRTNGKTICAASAGGVVCDAAPGVPVAEVCDGIDNDCNGSVDDVPGQLAGDEANCGGCGLACPTRPSAIASCVAGGCVSTCAAGFVDVDRDPANGCECRLTNGGVEACDGLDNDCNGTVDDDGGATYYDGPATTLGIGVCRAGAQACKNGQLVMVQPARSPTPEVCDGLDNDCNGTVDDGFDLFGDPRNCGACGLVCPAGVACQMGRCAGGDGMGAPDGGSVTPPTDAGGGAADAGILPGVLTACAGPTGTASCTDLGSDPANCGACGVICAPGQACLKALCGGPTGGGAGGAGGGTCPAPAILCADITNTKMYCTDPGRDPSNCGGCGKICPANAICTDGVCQGGGGSTPGLAACPGANGAPFCTNLFGDPANCGACGHVCAAPLVCNGGSCAATAGPTTCPPDLKPCADPTGKTTCANPLYDPANCGVCGNVCPAGAACMNAACIVVGGPDGGAVTSGVDGGVPPATCAPGFALCPSATGQPVCADLLSDRANCGGCQITCPATMTCVQKICM